MSDDENDLSEYELDDGSRYLLNKADAESRGAKAVKPADKQSKPASNKQSKPASNK